MRVPDDRHCEVEFLTSSRFAVSPSACAFCSALSSFLFSPSLDWRSVACCACCGARIPSSALSFRISSFPAAICFFEAKYQKKKGGKKKEKKRQHH